MFEDVDWSEGEAHMRARHGVTMVQAIEAAADPCLAILDPDPASRSGRSFRIIGWSESRQELLTVILLRAGGVIYGVNGWESDNVDRKRYREWKERES